MKQLDKEFEQNKRTLTSAERKELRNSIEQVVLAPVFSHDDHEHSSTAYLRLIHSSDIAHKECADLLEDAVHQARRINHSWAVIGDILGISRQAAQQRFNPNNTSENDRDKTLTRRITGAHAFNEMALLEVEGKAGNHLVGFGPLYLLVQESSKQWEHKRVTNFSWQNKEALEKKGWTYIGSWLPFLYYKRSL